MHLFENNNIKIDSEKNILFLGPVDSMLVLDPLLVWTAVQFIAMQYSPARWGENLVPVALLGLYVNLLPSFQIWHWSASLAKEGWLVFWVPQIQIYKIILDFYVPNTPYGKYNLFALN